MSKKPINQIPKVEKVTLTPSSEVDICCNCPFPKCTRRDCQYYKDEKKKLQTKK